MSAKGEEDPLHPLSEEPVTEYFIDVQQIKEDLDTNLQNVLELREFVSKLNTNGNDIPAGETTKTSPKDTQPDDNQLSLEHLSVIDPVGLYLREMSRVPLLMNDEEVSLAKRIVCGRISHNQLNNLNGKASPQEVETLKAAIRDGELAREQLIKANTRLVVSIAKKYVGRGVPFLDLI